MSATAARTDRAFGQDVLVNMASLAFLAAAGLVLNFAIGRFYGAATLGLFNVIFALYIFVSQLGVFGIHFSLLKYVSQYSHFDAEKTDAAIAGALMLVAVVSSIVTIIAFAMSSIVAKAYEFQDIEKAWLAILPGLWAFSINKVLLAAINGKERMKLFAVMQALRYVLILSALGICLILNPAAWWVVSVISVGEVLLLPVLLFCVSRLVTRWNWQGGTDWLGEHLNFGSRVFLSGTIGELNTRIDVLLLGAMLNNTQTGIYSVALLLAEGLAQAVTVVRSNLNPIITRSLTEGRPEELVRFGKKLSLWFTGGMFAAGTILVAAFATLVTWLLPDASFKEAIWPLSILVAGLVLASTYLPFGMIFSQTGQPFAQTLMSLLILGGNVLFNIALIPHYGIIGAAIGTALSYILTAIVLMVVLRRWFGIKIWI